MRPAHSIPSMKGLPPHGLLTTDVIAQCVRVGTFIAGLWLAVNSQTAMGQAMSVAQLLGKQDQWEAWATSGTRLILTGRYEGRTAQVFRLRRVPFSFEPPRNSPLPDRMRDGQRIEVSGRLSTTTGRMIFDVNRLSVDGTDTDIIRERQQAISSSDFASMYALAEEFQPFAEFYSDQALTQDIRTLREAAVQKERRHLKGKTDELWALAEKSTSLKLNSHIAEAIRYEAMFTEWKQASGGTGDVIQKIQNHAKGWEQKNLNGSERIEQAFLSDPVSAYNTANDADRTWLHRRLYRAILLEKLQSQLHADGSNGLDVASQVRESIPEESTAIEMMESKDLEFRLGRVKTLSRAELEKLSDLLISSGHAEDVATTVDEWVEAQEVRYRSSGLAGLLRTADEHLFAGSRWNRIEHTQEGTELLKQAWTMASKQSARDADGIADRLRTLGWERLKDQWMTSTQIELLPKDDIQLAMREGRVVRGMTAEQVVGTLGQPARVSRIISSRIIRELWIYDAQGSSGVIVQFQRNRRDVVKDGRVTDVSATSTNNAGIR